MSKSTGMIQAEITDDMIEEMKGKAGIPLRIDHSVCNEDATRIAVLKFVDGIGDPNPLWRDEEYARCSPYGGLVAPPSFAIGCFSGIQFGWPGLGSFHSESKLQFLRPIRIGDKITASCVYDGFDGPKPGSFAGRMVVDKFTNTYHNQRDELVATIKWEVINFERANAKERGKYSSLPVPHSWREEELKVIESEVLAEEPRGSAPRWWEDVEIGQPLDEVVKGPIGLTDEIAFIAGGGAPIPRLAAHGVALRAYEKHPAWAFRDSEYGSLEPIYAVHYNKDAANGMGVPLQYDVGFQRQCWQIHLLTNWMGDHGWITRAAAQYRRFVYLSDVVRLGGVVTAKYVDDTDEACVDVTTYARNQRGEDVMPGSATIALPSRGNQSPVERRCV